MMKRIGFALLFLMFLMLYITVAIEVFSGRGTATAYLKNEFSFGSINPLSIFIVLTIILLIGLNYLIDQIFDKKRKAKKKGDK